MSFTLFLMRHAKSDWSGSDLSDFDRPINARGQKNSHRVGRWLNESNNIPQHIVSSTALRAKQTTELMVGALSSKPENILYNDILYLASVDTLLDYIHRYKTGLKSLMLVAHNPGLEDLVTYLLAKSASTNNSISSMATANVAIFEYANRKFDIYHDKAKLIDFIRPSDI
jgi:phosphohistidine phosphatase